MTLDVDGYIKVFERVAEKRGWELNPDADLVADFARGLIENKRRYGMAICPCRFPVGDKEIDRLIVCPCVYAEDDIREFGRCYCGLYLRKDADESVTETSIPDRHAKYYLM